MFSLSWELAMNETNSKYVIDIPKIFVECLYEMHTVYPCILNDTFRTCKSSCFKIKFSGLKYKSEALKGWKLD